MKKISHTEGVVFVEVAVGLTLLFMLTGAVLLFTQTVKEANTILEASRYAARLSAAPIVAQVSGDDDRILVVNRAMTTPGTETESPTMIEDKARALVRRYLVREGSLADSNGQQADVDAKVLPVIEDTETFWVVQVDVTMNRPTNNFFGILSPFRMVANSRSTYLIQSVIQG